MTTRILGGKGNRTRRSQKTSCRATTSRRPPTRYERSHTRKVNLCIIQVLGSSKRSQFIANVFPAELKEISGRRTKLGMAPLDIEDAPSLDLGLVGLAFSGGGIRSATFALGVVQALAKHKVLRLVDYLSTVSGGGYIGACLSSILNAPHTDYDSDFPLRREVGAEETPGVRHLRNSGNYLAPNGLFDTLRIPTLLLRGILINFAVFLPYILLCVLATEIVYERFHHIDFLYT